MTEQEKKKLEKGIWDGYSQGLYKLPVIENHELSFVLEYVLDKKKNPHYIDAEDIGRIFAVHKSKIIEVKYHRSQNKHLKENLKYFINQVYEMNLFQLESSRKDSTGLLSSSPIQIAQKYSFSKSYSYSSQGSSTPPKRIHSLVNANSSSEGEEENHYVYIHQFNDQEDNLETSLINYTQKEVNEGLKLTKSLKIGTWNTKQMALLNKKNGSIKIEGLYKTLSKCDLIVLQEIPKIKAKSRMQKFIKLLRTPRNWSFILSQDTLIEEDNLKTAEKHAVIYRKDQITMLKTSHLDRMGYSTIVVYFEKKSLPNYTFILSSIHIPIQESTKTRYIQRKLAIEKFDDACFEWMSQDHKTYKKKKDTQREIIPILSGNFISIQKNHGVVEEDSESSKRFSVNEGGSSSYWKLKYDSQTNHEQYYGYYVNNAETFFDIDIQTPQVLNNVFFNEPGLIELSLNQEYSSSGCCCSIL